MDIFHTGDLQSGISRAISEGKLVACFVREPGNEQSSVWEDEWLQRNIQDPSSGNIGVVATGHVFSRKAVLLRLDLGSEEVNFLNAFCPIQKAPTFVVIHNGRVLENVESGVGREEWTRRICSALGIDVQGDIGGEDEMREQTADLGKEEAQQSQETTSQDTIGSNTAQEGPSTYPQAQPANLPSLFPNRAQRLDEENSRRQAAEKAERIARSNQRRKEAEEAQKAASAKGKGRASDDPSSDQRSARHDWLVQQQQRKEEARKERERVLAQIEADKQERRTRAQRGPDETSSEALPAASKATEQRSVGQAAMCSLQIRLFDGSSVKTRFDASATLAADVRNWISTQQQQHSDATDVPYTFKQILAPQPSRAIEVSDEHRSVAELGLAPTATLVLVPVRGYTDAYSGGGGGGYVGAALGVAYSAVGTAAGLVATALSYVPGLGGAAAQHARAVSDGEGREQGSASVASSSRVATLADRRRDGETGGQAEFYNGNSSAFEGRKDESEEGKGKD